MRFVGYRGRRGVLSCRGQRQINGIVHDLPRWRLERRRAVDPGGRGIALDGRRRFTRGETCDDRRRFGGRGRLLPVPPPQHRREQGKRRQYARGNGAPACVRRPCRSPLGAGVWQGRCATARVGISGCDMRRLRRCVARLAGLHGIEHARDVAHLARPTFAFVLFVTPRAGSECAGQCQPGGEACDGGLPPSGEQRRNLQRLSLACRAKPD